jgi:hypothetical protein
MSSDRTRQNARGARENDAALGELLPAVTQYRAGLDAEIAMLHQLAALAVREREVTATGSLLELDEISDGRDRVMASLVTVESQLKPIRRVLLESLDRLKAHPAFAALAALHQEAAALAADIVASDDQSLASLREAELARRYAAESLKQGETTLAAYRRVVTPSLANATLVNRRG